MDASLKLGKRSRLSEGDNILKDKGYLLPSWGKGKVYSALFFSWALPYLSEVEQRTERRGWVLFFS